MLILLILLILSLVATRFFSCVSVLENDSGKKDLCSSDSGDLLLPCPTTTSENPKRYHGLNQVSIKIISRPVNISKLIQSTHDT